MSRPKRSALGRGLGALIPDAPQGAPETPSPTDGDQTPAGQESRPLRPRTLPIERLEPNPDQPRKHFDPEALRELADSITKQGLIQPIVVAPAGRDRYQILAGERRWRACQLAGLHDVEVVVRDTPEERRLELALVENIQRADLNPIEEARAFQQLIDLRGMTQAEVADRVGKDRSTVANAVRLLGLPTRVQDMVMGGRLSMGHARALLGLESDADMTALAHEVLERKLSVRATEAEVRRRLRPEPEDSPVPDEVKRHRIIVADIEHRLRAHLGVKVKLSTGDNPRGPGRVELRYGDLDELNRLLNQLLGDGTE